MTNLKLDKYSIYWLIGYLAGGRTEGRGEGIWSFQGLVGSRGDGS